MNKYLDKALRYKILSDLATSFPVAIDFEEAEGYEDIENNKLIANLLYLEQSGYISSGIEQTGLDTFHYNKITTIFKSGLDVMGCSST